jgi:hypothetical protein
VSKAVATHDAGAGAQISERVLRQFADMVAMLPQDDTGGTESIVAQILAAETFEELDSPWSASDTEDLIGTVLTIESVKARRSDYADGLGFYVIATGKVYGTDKPVTFTTGSVSVVAQLVKAYAMGALPLVCTLQQAERPTEKGYRPQHLAIVTPDRGNG